MQIFLVSVDGVFERTHLTFLTTNLLRYIVSYHIYYIYHNAFIMRNLKANGTTRYRFKIS